LKRILKIIIFSFFSGFVFLLVPSFYLIAKAEDIIWIDEEDEEIDSLQPENNEATQTTDSLQPENNEATQTTDSLQPENNEATEEITDFEQEFMDDSSDKSSTTDNTIEESSTTDNIEIDNIDTIEESSFTPEMQTEEVSPEVNTNPDITEDPITISMSSGDEYERSLYDIFVKYYSKSVTSEEWNSVVSNKDIYTIQEKDTLWDISKVLFGDPSYWPKLWAVNPSLTNPHLISPGGNLGFIYGTEGSPPSLNLVQQNTGTTTGDTKKESRAIAPTPKFLQGITINAAEFRSTKNTKSVMSNFPTSLPNLSLSSDLNKTPELLDISFKSVTRPTSAFLSHYITSRPPKKEGFVLKNKENGTWSHIEQRVIIEMNEPANPGQKITVIKNLGKLNPSISGVRGPFGYQIQIQGELEIIGRLPDSFDLYEARVTKSISPIEVSADIINGTLVEFNYQTTNAPGDSEAQIIGVPTYTNREEKYTSSPYSLVYLNRGTNSGITAGQMYQIRVNPDIKRINQYGYDVKLGEVKIIYSDKRFATGIITQMQNPILVGDYITSLGKGLATQINYDPFEDDVEEIKEEVTTDNFPPNSAEDVKSDPEDGGFYDDDEDVFEAFE